VDAKCGYAPWFLQSCGLMDAQRVNSPRLGVALRRLAGGRQWRAVFGPAGVGIEDGSQRPIAQKENIWVHEANFAFFQLKTRGIGRNYGAAVAALRAAEHRDAATPTRGGRVMGRGTRASRRAAAIDGLCLFGDCRACWNSRQQKWWSLFQFKNLVGLHLFSSIDRPRISSWRSSPRIAEQQ